MMANKKTIKVNFTDIYYKQPDEPVTKFWAVDSITNQLPFIPQNIQDKYNIEISEEPDFLIYSVFGHGYEKIDNCVKIFYTGEVVVPNFNNCDYAIGYDNITFDGRYLKYPYYYNFLKESMLDKSHIDISYAKRKFCNFIASNDSCGEGAVLRKELCQKLMEYKRVDCPGKVLNNMQNAIKPIDSDWANEKMKFQKNYKFSIAFENCMSIGYTTEKLPLSFEANTIPIYWGNPEVIRDFNPKAFINCNDYNSLDEVVQRVIELDNNDEEYMKMLMEPCVNPGYTFDKEKLLEDFYDRIFEKGNKPFNKLPLPAFNKCGYVGTLEEGQLNNPKYKDFLEIEKFRLKIMKNITFGKKRKKYQDKYQICKKQLKNLT